MNSFSTALTAMRRSPYQSLAAILMLTLTCFVGYAFSLFLLTAQDILQYFETRPQIIGFFELDTQPEAIVTVENTLKQKNYVEDVTIVSQEQALELYRSDNAEDPLLLELVTADILPASIEVSGKSLNDLALIKQDLETTTTIEDVIYQQDVVSSLSAWTSSVRLIGVASIVLLSVMSFLIIMVIIGMKATTKKQAIHIMRIIGATYWYIKWPFIVESIIYGLVGSLLGWLIMYAGFLYLTPWLDSFLGTITVTPITYSLFAIQLGVGTLLSTLLSGFAGSVAVQRQIRK
ncbi:MAG: permease-like cell division protein FtsX [bacterium]|nr:permease-like cell division protein FtsX [bacterium]